MFIPFPAVSAGYTPRALSCGISFLGAMMGVPSKRYRCREDYQRFGVVGCIFEMFQ